jgi:hypothetical protein
MKKAEKSEEIGKRYFKFREAIFGRTVHVLINFSRDDYIAWVRKLDPSYHEDEKADDFAAWSVDMVKDGISEWIICLKRFNWSIRDQGSLIHEIVHTIIKIWKSNNIPFTPDNQEFLAHSIGNLYEDIAAAIFKIKRK